MFVFVYRAACLLALKTLIIARSGSVILKYMIHICRRIFGVDYIVCGKIYVYILCSCGRMSDADMAIDMIRRQIDSQAREFYNEN